MARALVDGWSGHKLLRPDAKMRLSHLACPEAFGSRVVSAACWHPCRPVARAQIAVPLGWAGLGGESRRNLPEGHYIS